MKCSRENEPATQRKFPLLGRNFPQPGSVQSQSFALQSVCLHVFAFCSRTYLPRKLEQTCVHQWVLQEHHRPSWFVCLVWLYFFGSQPGPCSLKRVSSRGLPSGKVRFGLSSLHRHEWAPGARSASVRMVGGRSRCGGPGVQSGLGLLCAAFRANAPGAASWRPTGGDSGFGSRSPSKLVIFGLVYWFAVFLVRLPLGLQESLGDPCHRHVANAASTFSRQVLKGHVWDLSCHPTGCRLVQLALENAKQRQASELGSELKGHVQEAMASPHANYVVQKIHTCLQKRFLLFFCCPLFQRSSLFNPTRGAPFCLLGLRILTQLLWQLSSVQLSLGCAFKQSKSQYLSDWSN